jgi:hypothetical protein
MREKEIMICFSEFNKQFTGLFFNAVSKSYNRTLTKSTVLTCQFFFKAKHIQVGRIPAPPPPTVCGFL